MSVPTASRGLRAGLGVVVALAGLAVGVAVGWWLDTINPVVAVAELVRDKTPGPIAVRLVHLVQHADKPLLVTGTAVIVLLIAAYAGILNARSPFATRVIFIVLAAIGVVAELRPAGGGVTGVVATLAGLLTWLVALPLLLPFSEPVAASESIAGETRRGFVLRGLGVLAFGALALGAGRYVSQGRRAVEQARSLLHLKLTPGTVPAGADVGVPGIPSWRTPSGSFYRIDTAITPPAVSPTDWQLRIHGLVDHQITLTFDQLVRRSLVSDWVTLCCVSNPVGGPLIGNAYWTGVPIRELLAEAGVQSSADAVLQTSHDGWTCGTPLSALTDPHRQAMLAVAMNGQPLPIDHGFPVRMVVPGLYGYVSATKWLTDLEVTRFDRFEAYWTRAGWSPQGPVKTESRVDVPRDGGSVRAGQVRVGGSAWAQHIGIAHVEYQLNGGPWRKARLGSVPGADTWVQWTATVPVKPGSHKLAVRATNKDGYTQTGVQAGVLPNGATGWDTVGFSAS